MCMALVIPYLFRGVSGDESWPQDIPSEGYVEITQNITPQYYNTSNRLDLKCESDEDQKSFHGANYDYLTPMAINVSPDFDDEDSDHWKLDLRTIESNVLLDLCYFDPRYPPAGNETLSGESWEEGHRENVLQCLATRRNLCSFRCMDWAQDAVKLCNQCYPLEDPETNDTLVEDQDIPSSTSMVRQWTDLGRPSTSDDKLYRFYSSEHARYGSSGSMMTASQQWPGRLEIDDIDDPTGADLREIGIWQAGAIGKISFGNRLAIADLHVLPFGSPRNSKKVEDIGGISVRCPHKNYHSNAYMKMRNIALKDFLEGGHVSCDSGYCVNRNLFNGPGHPATATVPFKGMNSLILTSRFGSSERRYFLPVKAKEAMCRKCDQKYYVIFNNSGQNDSHGYDLSIQELIYMDVYETILRAKLSETIVFFVDSLFYYHMCPYQCNARSYNPMSSRCVMDKTTCSKRGISTIFEGHDSGFILNDAIVRRLL